MSLQLFAHPLSSYCQKVLTAFYENDTPFTYREISFDGNEVGAEFARLWPIQRMPLLRDGDIIEIDAETGTLWRVRAGPEADRGNADKLKGRIKEKLKLDGMVVTQQ
jgi:glutathione S-transferase